MDRDQASSIDEMAPTFSCFTCRDMGFVSPDVDRDHPVFGQAQLCPSCHGRHERRRRYIPYKFTLGAGMQRPQQPDDDMPF